MFLSVSSKREERERERERERETNNNHNHPAYIKTKKVKYLSMNSLDYLSILLDFFDENICLLYSMMEIDTNN